MSDTSDSGRAVSCLVVYASKHGATAAIASRIGEVLTAHGLRVDVLPATEAPSPASWDAVVLGSAVYAGQWRKDAAGFLERHAEVLAQRPVWLFSSGPTGAGEPSETLQGWCFPERLRPVADRIQPRSIALFHGALDTATLNIVERWMVKAVKAPVGDYRDWDAVESWARDIARALGNR